MFTTVFLNNLLLIAFLFISNKLERRMPKKPWAIDFINISISDYLSLFPSTGVRIYRHIIMNIFSVFVALLFCCCLFQTFVATIEDFLTIFTITEFKLASKKCLFGFLKSFYLFQSKNLLEVFFSFFFSLFDFNENECLHQFFVMCAFVHVTQKKEKKHISFPFMVNKIKLSFENFNASMISTICS